MTSTLKRATEAKGHSVTSEAYDEDVARRRRSITILASVREVTGSLVETGFYT
jgi:hypothetical protein